jgi:hypothetical protein
MPRDSARARQLRLFVRDTVGYLDAVARYEAIRPVLKGERSLPQQSHVTGINYWRLWRDLQRFRRSGLLGVIDQRTLPHARGKPRRKSSCPDISSNRSCGWPWPIPLPLANWRGLCGTATAMPSITAGFHACSCTITSPPRPCGVITNGLNKPPHLPGHLGTSWVSPLSRPARRNAWNKRWAVNICASGFARLGSSRPRSWPAGASVNY